MDKNEFLKKLNDDLSSLTDEERADALKYYEEYCADAEENNDAGNNITEFQSPDDLTDKIQEVIEKNNKPSGIKLVLEDSILEETIKKIEEDEKQQELIIEVKKEDNASNNQTQKQTLYNVNNDYETVKADKSNNNDNTLKIVLIVCTIPFWLPLLIALGSTAFGLFMALLGIAFAVAATAVAGFIMVGAGFMSVGYGVFNIFTNISNAFYPIGAGFVSIGLGLIIAYIFTKLTAVLFKSQFKFAGWAIRGISDKFSRRGA